MILPIGHQESSVRRLPWVSFALIAACVVSFLATDLDAVDAPAAYDESLRSAADYWADHAYLDAEAEVKALAAKKVRPGQRDPYLELLQLTSRDMKPSPELLGGQQDRLDELTETGQRAAAEAWSSDNPFARWGLIPASPRLGAFFTHMFMHAGWLHLIGNLFILFLAGPPLEDRYGRPLFAAFYLLAGVFAAATYMLLTPHSPLPMIGASGAVAGLLGAFLVRFWSTKIKFIYVFFLGFRFAHGTFEAPAYLMLPLWFGAELLQAWMMHATGATDGIAYWAHVGGFVFGAGAALAIRASQVEERFIHSAIEAKVTVSKGNDAVEEAMVAREQGDLDAAHAILQTELARTPDDPDVILAFWDLAVGRQEPESAAPAMTRLIRLTAGRDPTLASQHWIELVTFVPRALADPSALMRILPVFLESDDPKHAVRVLRHAVDPTNKGLSPGIALRVVEQAGRLDPPTALRAARSVLGFPDIDETKRARVEELIASLVAQGVSDSPTVESETGKARAKDGRLQLDADGSIPLGPDWAEDDLRKDPRKQHGTPDSSEPSTGQGTQPRSKEPAALELSADGQLVTGESDSDLAQAIPEMAPPLPPPLSVPSPPLSAPAQQEQHPQQQPPALPTSPPPLPTQAVPLPALLPPLESAGPVSTPLVDASLVLEQVAPTAQIQDVGELPPTVPNYEGPDGHARGAELDDLVASTRFSSLKVIDVKPTALAHKTLYFQDPGGRKAKVPYSDVEAVSVAVVMGMGPRPVILIDLALNWTDLEEGSLRVLRIRSDAFDPRGLISGTAKPMDAFRSLLEQILARTGAIPLPTPEAARGRPFEEFGDLDTYQREVLKVEG